MAIRFVEIKASDNPEALNSEWVILANDGKVPFHTRGCGMTVGRRGSAKKSLLGIIDPGFVLAPGQGVKAYSLDRSVVQEVQPVDRPGICGEDLSRAALVVDVVVRDNQSDNALDIATQQLQGDRGRSPAIGSAEPDREGHR